MHALLPGLGLIVSAAAAAYALLAALAAALAAARCKRGDGGAGAAQPAVTVLKPLCGNEFELYERLRSLCAQDYPRSRLQIVFGVHSPADSALPVVQRLQQQFDNVDIECVINPARHGVNAKVSNLVNMLPQARHDLLIIADSDIAVPPDYLARVLAPLSDPQVGLVTCPYAGRPAPGWWSTFGAQFINDWFMPNVYLASLFGSRAYVSGATIALRRGLLSRCGGLTAVADQLADDFQLGMLMRRQGLRIVLSDLRVDTLVDEPGLAACCRHALRWLRTIYCVRPWAYAGCFITFSLPMVALGAALARFQPGALRLLAITVAARLMIHFGRHADSWRRHGWLQLGLIPLHDMLLLALWCWSFSGREIMWRHERFGIRRDGSLHRVR